MPTTRPPYTYERSVKSDVSDELVNVWLQRPLAGLVTRAVYSTPLTPNHLTIIALVFGIAGGMLLASDGAKLTAAAICFYLKDVFDSADGQLARAKQLYSRGGRFLDSIGDFVVNLFLFGGIFIALHHDGTSLFGALIISIIGFLGVSLRVSYHVFYQTSYLHSRNEYLTNRTTEDFRKEDYSEDKVTMGLQRVFLVLYGWQDNLMKRLDGWSSRKVRLASVMSPAQWYGDETGLRLGGFLGIGTEFVLLTASLLLDSLWLYLFISMIVLNGVWIVTMYYRRVVLAKKMLEAGGTG